MKASYETLVLLEPSLGEGEVTEYTRKLETFISRHKGKLLKETSLGRKKLAYPVKKKIEGSYVLLEFEMEPGETKEYERSLRLESKILRQMTLRRN